MPTPRITLATIYQVLQDHSASLDSIDRERQDNSANFDSINRTLHDHTARFDSIDRTLQDHGAHFESIDRTLHDHSDRFESINRTLQDHGARFGSIDQTLQGHSARFDASDRIQQNIVVTVVSIKDQLDEHSAILGPLRERMEALYGLVDTVEVRTGRLDQEHTMITAALRRLEDRFDRLEAEKLRDRITALESRVSAFESPDAKS